MGNCFTISEKDGEQTLLPIHSAFKLPSPLPTWASGGSEFGSGYIDVGGLQVCQISTFNQVWATYEGGPDNLGATIFEPSSIPQGFSILGYYIQPNNQPLFGWVLAGRDTVGDTLLKGPSDYSLVWSSESLKINQTSPAYIWLPVPPEGYKAVGHLVTASLEKPPADCIMCVREDLTEECEVEKWVWSLGKSADPNGFNIYHLRPRNRGTQSQGVSVGTFANNNTSLACLKNNKFTTFSSMPNLTQLQQLFQEYSPTVYFHPKETYLPSSVNWFFANGALLYKQGDESNPVPVDPNGANLPQGGSDDGAYWLDLPVDETAKETVKKGDLKSAEVYLHVKPMLGATFTDIVMWLFYPFNGPATVKLGPVDIPLSRTGEHVGDWEHMTLRISNFNGVLYKMYFSAHSGGSWVESPNLEFLDGSNKPAAYSSLNGHANYSKPGMVLQGVGDEIGLRNDTAKSNMVLESGLKYTVVAAESVAEPQWLNYARKWGPEISYKIGREVEALEEVLKGSLKDEFQSLVDLLPDEVFGEEGPTGPKAKDSWSGDER